MKRKLVFATNNAHKLEEVSSILADKVELLSLGWYINCHTDMPPKQRTSWKVRVSEHPHLPKTMIDCFAGWHWIEEALRGLGVYSGLLCWGEGLYNAEAVTYWNSQCELEGKRNRRAQVSTAISLILTEKSIFEGVIKGEIIKEKEV